LNGSHQQCRRDALAGNVSYDTQQSPGLASASIPQEGIVVVARHGIGGPRGKSDVNANDDRR
jgi:hypothetical protein